MPHSVGEQRGFSLIETIVSLALVLTMMATIIAVMDPAQGAFQAEPERSDVQQRLRVSAATLYNDLLMAGAGTDAGNNRGPLTFFFAPVLPFRQGLRQSDPPGVFKSDTLTVIYVPSMSAQTTIAQATAAQTTDVMVNSGSGCPAGDVACGFGSGMSAVIYDRAGYVDYFTVTDVRGPSLHIEHDTRDTARSYAAGSTIAQVVARTYYLKSDAVTKTYQLMQYDGGNGNDVPVVDHVVSLRFDYYGESRPPMVRRPLSATIAPWTSYGPRPPQADTQSTAYPPGENCVFSLDGEGEPVPRLPVLANPTSLVPLTAAELTDGPWCPDWANPNRFDADLLRVRKIAVTLRVEAAVGALRGPTGPLFNHAGTARTGGRLVPDKEVRFEVSPRNLNLAR